MDGPLDLAGCLGANLSSLRKDRGLTQARLAGHSGIPRSTIAQLESGGGNPSLKNLAGLASSLRVTIEELLARPRSECELTLAKDLPRSERGHGSVRLYRLLPASQPGLQLEKLEMLPGGFMRGLPHIRGTKEYLTCLSGAVRLTVAGRDFTLGPGDLLSFPGDQPHGYHNPGRTTATAISMVALVPAERP